MSEMSGAKQNAFKVLDHLQAMSSLEKPVMFHIMQIFNISKSRLNQLDDWKEHEDPHNVFVDRLSKAGVRDRQTNNRVIREVNMEEDSGGVVADSSAKTTYKLLLRDYTNNYCYAYELNSLPFLRNETTPTGTPLHIELGGRLLVKRGTMASHGVLMLLREQCEYLGIDPEDKPLFDTLNTSLVKKYIQILEEELKRAA